MTAGEPRRLIVNADDLGMDPDIDAGILAGHRQGIVTSASLMVHGRSAGEAVRAASRHPELSVGLHLDLCEWDYVEGGWRANYERVDPSDLAAVRREAGEQLRLFRELAGADPTHLDSHQHVHQQEPALTAARELAGQLAVPLRGQTPGIAFRGEFYGQTGRGDPYPEGITRDGLSAVLESLAPGVTELGCHPGHRIAREVSSYALEREIELAVLCDPEVRRMLDSGRIELVSYREVRHLAEGHRPDGDQP